MCVTSPRACAPAPRATDEVESLVGHVKSAWSKLPLGVAVGVGVGVALVGGVVLPPPPPEQPPSNAAAKKDAKSVRAVRDNVGPPEDRSNDGPGFPSCTYRPDVNPG